MKSRINLYQDSFKPTFYLLNPSLVVYVWILLAVAVAVVTVWAGGKAKMAERELSTLNTLVDNKQNVVKMLSETVANMQQDPQLLTDIQHQQDVLLVKSSVMEELNKRHDQKSNGFSELMLDLARNHQSELWLTQIYLNEQQIRIEGGTTESSAVPKWVNNLSNADYFKGRSFASAHLYRDKQEQLHFVLNSEVTELQSQEGDLE